MEKANQKLVLHSTPEKIKITFFENVRLLYIEASKTWRIK